MTLVSVVTPAYNDSETLERTVRSVKCQSYNNIEHIIVDDGSTDDTPQVVGDLQHHQLRYIQFDQNRGANAARNVGIQESKGDLICFLDADDELHENHILHVVTTAQNEGENCVGVATSYMQIDINGNKTINYTPNENMGINNFSDDNPIGSFSATTFKKDVFGEVGRLDEEFQAAQDYEFYLRVSKNGYTIRGINEILLTKYNHSENISSNLERKQQGFDLLIQKHGDTLSSKRLATQHNMLGLISANSGNFDIAASEFQTAITLNPLRPLYFYHFVISYISILYTAGVVAKKRVNRLLYSIKTKFQS